jgi:hypothetical protein
VPNIVAIVSDDKIRKQIQEYCAELPGDNIPVVTFKSAAEFEAVYFKPRVGKVEGAPDESAAPVTSVAIEIKPLKHVHVLIFAADSISEKVPHWTSQTIRKLKDFGYWPEGNRSRLILLKYEDDNISKLDVLLPELDDLIYLPLDRLIFLQKTEIIMNLPKKTKGSFLFTQEFKQEIEISKIAKLELASDVGFAVRNPVPIKSGIRAKFYIQLPGEKEMVRFFAKSVRSVAHADLPGQFLSYFSFFGLRKQELTKIRQWLGKTKHYKPLKNEDRKIFKLDLANLFIPNSVKRIRDVVIIDPSDDLTLQLSAQITKEMDCCQVTTQSSYTYFVHKYLKDGDVMSSAENLPRPTKAEDFPNAAVTLRINSTTKNLVDMSFMPTANQMFLGQLATDLFHAGTEDWWKLFKSADNDLILDESIELLKEKKSRSKVVIAGGSSEHQFAVRITFDPTKDPEVFSLSITPVNAKEMVDHLGSPSSLLGIDTVIIDAAFIPSDFNAWLEYLRTTAHQKGLLPNPESLKIILMTEREDKLDRSWLDCPQVVGLLVKPIDSRQLLFLLSEALNNSYTAYEFKNIGWANALSNCHMSREMELEALSEFGATLKSATPFQPGSFFFLRKSIFDQAPNNCLAARVYACEPHASEKEFFSVHVIYYGINDSFLKYARTWIRENYAASKAQAG